MAGDIPWMNEKSWQNASKSCQKPHGLRLEISPVSAYNKEHLRLRVKALAQHLHLGAQPFLVVLVHDPGLEIHHQLHAALGIPVVSLSQQLNKSCNKQAISSQSQHSLFLTSVHLSV